MEPFKIPRYQPKGLRSLGRAFRPWHVTYQTTWPKTWKTDDGDDFVMSEISTCEDCYFFWFSFYENFCHTRNRSASLSFVSGMVITSSHCDSTLIFD